MRSCARSPTSSEGGAVEHLLGNFQVSIAGEHARSVCRIRVFDQGLGTKASLEPFECFGEYHDELRRCEEGWRIVRREMITTVSGDFGVSNPHPSSERPGSPISLTTTRVDLDVCTRAGSSIGSAWRSSRTSRSLRVTSTRARNENITTAAIRRLARSEDRTDRATDSAAIGTPPTVIIV